MSEHGQYLAAHGRSLDPRPSGMTMQTALDINNLQDEIARKQAIKAVIAGAAIAVIPQFGANAASISVQAAEEGIFDRVTHYFMNNWEMIIPIAAVDGIIDGVIGGATSEDETTPQSYVGNVVKSAIAEGVQMTTVLLAAAQVADHPDVLPTLNKVGRVVLPVAAIVALFPDAAKKYLKPAFNWTIDSGASVLKGIVERETR